MTTPTVQVFEWSPDGVNPLPGATDGSVIAAFTDCLRRLQSKGALVARHDVRLDRAALDANPTVKSAFDAQGPDCLPMVVVNETIISVGGYPTRVELVEAAGMSAGTDPELLGELVVESAALGAALTANAFERFQQHCERLMALGLRRNDLEGMVQSAAAAASTVVRDEMRTRVEQWLAFGPQGKLPKPRCACSDNV